MIEAIRPIQVKLAAVAPQDRDSSGSIAHNITKGYARISQWLTDTRRGISAVVRDRDLASAMLPAERYPEEGARYRLGETLRVYRADGLARRFKIFGIRSGGFSNVYTVVDLEEMKPYCLKENRELPGRESDDNADLAAEAEISLRLGSHFNIVSTFEAFYLDDRLFLRSEFVPMRSLNLRLRRGALRAADAVRLAIDLSRAMVHARKVLPGFVHGDIKPGNCLLTDSMALKLADFGSSSFGALSAQDSVTSHGPCPVRRFAGTHAYMAPELLRREKPCSPAADMFAFGATVIEMLIGSAEFALRPRRPPTAVFNELAGAAIPHRMKDLISRCIDPDEKRRPQNFEVIEKELSEICFTHFGSAPPNGSAAAFRDDEVVSRALSFSALGLHAEAVGEIDQRIGQNGVSPELLACKAETLVNGGFVDAAFGASRSALALDSGALAARLAHAKVLAAKNEPETARQSFRQAVFLHPQNCTALNQKARLDVECGDDAAAERSTRRSLLIDFCQTQALETLAEIEFRKGRCDNAIELARQSLRLNPRRLAAHLILRDVYRFRHDHFGTVEACRSMLRLSPHSKRGGRMFASACLELHRARGRSIDIGLARLLVRAAKLISGSLEGTNGDFAGEINRAFRDFDSDLLLVFCVGDAAAISLRGAPEGEAAMFAERLRTLLESSAGRDVPFDLLYALCRIFYELRMYADCREAGQRLLDSFGPDERAYYFLAASFEAEENLLAALKIYKKALRLENGEDNRLGVIRVRAKLDRSRSSP